MNTPITPGKLTLTPANVLDQRPPASGLYVTASKTFYRLDALWSERKVKRLRIGWARRCEVPIGGDGVLGVHAELERRGHLVFLHDCAGRYDMFIDGWQFVRPVPLLVGMTVVIGGVQLIATDTHGNFQILADTVSDLCRKATEMCGSHRAAGEKVGRSHNFVRKQFEPRSTRYKKKK